MKKVLNAIKALIRISFAHTASWIGTACVAVGVVLIGVMRVLVTLKPDMHPFIGVAVPLALPGLVGFGGALYLWGLWCQVKRVTPSGTPNPPPLAEQWNRTLQTLDIAPGTRVMVAVLVAAAHVAGLTSFGMWRTIHYMETPTFCGLACHSVMEPQWVAYNDSPHANVPCASCHIGKSLESVIKTKIQGSLELAMVLTGYYHVPVKGPVGVMPPVSETCADCHFLGRDYPNKLVVRRSYLRDKATTPAFGVVSLKMRDNEATGQHGIHRSVMGGAKVEYKSEDDKRAKILYVKKTDDDGKVEEFFLDDPHDDTKDLATPGARDLELRTVDCYDCHNRAAHRFATLEDAVDRAIADGRLSRKLPSIKIKAEKTLSQDFESVAEMEAELSDRFGMYYRAIDEKLKPEVERAAAELKKIYKRNVFPHLKIGWGLHESLIGHRGPTQGCFRCHNQRMRTKEGKVITQSCKLCHVVIADEIQKLSAKQIKAE